MAAISDPRRNWGGQGCGGSPSTDETDTQQTRWRGPAIAISTIHFHAITAVSSPHHRPQPTCRPIFSWTSLQRINLLNKLLAVDLKFAIANIRPIIAKLHKVKGVKVHALIAEDPGVPTGSCLHDGRSLLDKNMGIVVWNVEAQCLPE